MKRYTPILALFVISIFASGCTLYQTPPPAYGYQAPNNAPDRTVVSEPQFLYVIPSFGVYFVPNVSTEIFFVDGRWYYTVRGVWYWGSSYRGPWTHIEVRNVPGPLRRLPRDYRTRYRNKYYKVPYGHWQKRRQDLPPRSGGTPPPYVNKYKGNVYFSPRDPDVVFYDGSWYRRYKGLWYQGRSNSGPWRYPGIGFLPKAVKQLPPDYRQPGPGRHYKQVPWEQVQKKYRKKIDRRNREWGFGR